MKYLCGMQRARADQYAARVNVAVDLLATGLEVPKAMRRLAKRFGISERQARRYVEQARDLGRVDVPARSGVFTTRLPHDLIERLRGYARRSGHTLSSIVSQAVEEFLDRIRAGPRRGR